MLIDCQTCPAAGHHCGDCLVSAVLHVRPGLPLDDDERRGVETFLGVGLVAEAEAMTLRATLEPWVGARAVG